MALRMLLAVVAVTGVSVGWADAGTGKRGEPAPQDELVRLVYPVADLVVPIQNYELDKQPAPAKTLEGELMDLVRSTVAKETWKEVGGAGTIQYFPTGMALVVTQKREVQGEILDLLNALRRLQDLNVCIEMRIVQVRPVPSLIPDRVHKGIATIQERFAKSADDEKSPRIAFLTDEELAVALNEAQQDTATNIMQAPKLTIFNGQHASVVSANQQAFVTEYRVVREGDQVAIKPHLETIELGLRCGLLPTVSADRRSVMLKIDFRQTMLDGPVAEMPVVVRGGRKNGAESEIQAALQQPKVQKLTFKQACRIPDGQTMVVSLGQVLVETPHESEPPGLIKRIPYVNRLFRNMSWSQEDREVFLLVTPRIIVNEAEEQPVLTEIPRR